MQPALVDGFDREQWTTTGIQRLAAGDVFATRTTPLRPLVLTATSTIPPTAYETHGWIIATVIDPASGQRDEVKLPGNTSVVVRCDLTYTLTD